MKMLVRKKVVYDREVLFDEVWEQPVVKVAEKYGVSDVMIHKYCRKLEIPTPSPGYWRKKERGLKVQKKPKLPRYTGLSKIVGFGMFEEEIPDDEIEVNDSADKDEQVKPLRLSDELEAMCRKAVESVEIVARRKWHPVIEKHKMVFSEWAKNHRTDELAKCGEQQWEWHPYQAPLFWEQMTARTIPKFYFLANAIILALESAGCHVTDDFYAVIGDDRLKFGAFETRERVPHKPVGYEKEWLKEYEGRKYEGPLIRKYDYPRTGEINFYIHKNGWYSRWRPAIVHEKDFDNQKEFVAAVITELFQAVPLVRKERLEREDAERKRQEEIERRIRREELIRNEKQRVLDLMEKANDFILARNIRTLVSAVESKKNLTEEEKTWITWARDKADWIDPMIRKEDSILGKFVHKKAAPQEDTRDY